MEKEIFDRLMEMGWKDPQTMLPGIAKETAAKFVNQGKKYPAMIHNWLESEPVLIIIDAGEFGPDLLRLSRMAVCRSEYFDDNSGELQKEVTEDPAWFIGAVGYERAEEEYYDNERILAWRPLDDLLPESMLSTIKRETGSYKHNNISGKNNQKK